MGTTDLTKEPRMLADTQKIIDDFRAEYGRKPTKAEVARLDAFEAAAQIAEHLNGWGSRDCRYCREFADHIAKCIRLAAAVPMGK